MSRKFKHTKGVNGDVELDFELSESQKSDLSNLIEALMNKYSNTKIYVYHSGVVDGLNHAYKVVNGIDDDYLSDIEEL